MEINESRKLDIRLTEEEYENLYNSYCILYYLDNKLDKETKHSWLKNVNTKLWDVDERDFEIALEILNFCIDNINVNEVTK